MLLERFVNENMGFLDFENGIGELGSFEWFRFFGIGVGSVNLILGIAFIGVNKKLFWTSKMLLMS